MNAPAPRTNGKAATNVNAILSPGGAPARGPRSEATQVEQSRAVAEVQAMVTVAQARRRDVTRSMEAMKQSCAMMELAERAFFKFPRGGQTVAGPSIHLAVELARCWGNVNYGIRELSRDDFVGQSEMLAFAWDMETNSRADTTFIVPHMRDKKGGPEALTDMRDIYENNANNGARRLREMIFRIVPPWFREQAKTLCHETLQRGTGEKPLPVRISDMIAAFATIGVTRERIEARIQMSVEKMTAVDLANLIVSFKSIKAGEVTAADEFPNVAAAEVAQALASRPPSQSQGLDAGGGPDGNSKSEAEGSAATSTAETQKAAPMIEEPLCPEGAGQEEITGKIVSLIANASTVERVHAIIAANKDRTKTWTQANRAKITIAAEDKIEDLGSAS